MADEALNPAARPPCRRAVLAMLAGAGAAALPMPAAPAGPDPHPAWLAWCRELRALIDGCPAETPDAVTDPLAAELWRHEDLLHETVARTPAGLAAQAARLVEAVETETFGPHEEGGLRVLLAGLERLAAPAG